MSKLTNTQRSAIAESLAHVLNVTDANGRAAFGGLFGTEVTVTVDGKPVKAHLPATEVNRLVHEEVRLYLESWVVPPLAAVLGDAQGYDVAARDLREIVQYAHDGHRATAAVTTFYAPKLVSGKRG